MSQSGKPVIGVDIDDVIAEHIPDFVAYTNQFYGTNISTDTYHEDWPLLWNIARDETMERARKFHSDRVRHFTPIKGADEVLQTLSQRYRLVIVTARPQYTIDHTHEWIERHFKDMFTERHFVPIWEEDSLVTKADICRQVGADYLIDDLPRHCNVAADAGITPLLFGNYTWRDDHPLHDSVVKVMDWREIAEYFDVAR